MSHSSSLQDKKAPRAEPEEDIDVLEHEAQDKTLPGTQTLTTTGTADATDTTIISWCTPVETQDKLTLLERAGQLTEALKAEQGHGEFTDLSEDMSPPPHSPPPPPCPSASGECFESEGFYTLEREVVDWIDDGERISDLTEDLTSADVHIVQEGPQTPRLAEIFNTEVDSLTGDNVTKDENVTWLDSFTRGNIGQDYTSEAAASETTLNHYPPDRSTSDDGCTVCSPPFADESGEEEEVSSDIMSCQQQCSTLAIRDKPCHPSHSANIPTLPAVPSNKHQTELLTHSRCEVAPKGSNQEAAQQVLGQGSPPLSTVAMDLSNRGGAATQSSGCVVAARERHSGAGESTEEESRKAGGEQGQKEGGFEKNKTVELVRFPKTVQTQRPTTEKYIFLSPKQARMESDSCDDSQSDSGVSADFSPCSTLEGNTTITPGTPTAAPKETPIEREIRRAIEREHSLRRSRGLPNPPTSPEYVEIPLRKTVLCQAVTVKTERGPGKDRQLADKKMQQEIHEDVKREQDLVKLGKVQGFYDKGTVRQLKDRKLLFEAFQKPDDSGLTVTARTTMPWSSASDISNRENMSSRASTIGVSHMERNPTQSPDSTTRRGPGFSEGTGCQVIILENNLNVPAEKLYRPKQETVSAVHTGSPKVSSLRTAGGIKGREQEQEDEEVDVAPKENPFFKLRTSSNLVKVEQDIREAQERERELHKQRISLYGGKQGAKGGGVREVGEGGGERSSSTERTSPMLSSSSLNGLVVPGSSKRGETGPPAARQSVGKFAVWPPAQSEEKINQQETLHSPRSPRQKTPLVQRWESGLVNTRNEEDD